MIKNIVGYLEETEKIYKNKIAYVDEEKCITFGELKELSLKIANNLVDKIEIKTPVIVYMNKCVESIETFLAIAYINCFYVPLDIDMPYERCKLIIDTLKSRNILTRKKDIIPEEIRANCNVYYIEDLLSIDIDNKDKIDQIQKEAIDADPAYAIFTSGSTGIPKGVLVSHRSVINFTEWWCETFDFSNKEIFANQTPFYFDASVKDIYATLKCGATMYIVPKKLFLFPKKLVEYLNENKVTCIDWVPSALCMIANFNTFEKIKPEYLKKVMFLGEVMPTKQFNIWRRALPDVKFANLYGPTEATGDCTYYKIEREFDDDDVIPIGYPCNNTDVILLDGNTQITQKDSIGEICVRGCSLAYGYYNNEEKTNEVFVRNPLNNCYYERIYRTGDLGKFNSYGELVFVSRKDSQIKHMGHRIELGEIEAIISSLDKIERICCLYDNKNQKIVVIYSGEIEKEELLIKIKNKLPSYMIPNVFIKIDEMPINLNGKIDRNLLKGKYLSS